MHRNFWWASTPLHVKGLLCYTGSWGKGHWTLRKRSLPSPIFNTVPLLSFSGIPMLTHPQELNLRGSAPAVWAGCFKEKGHLILTAVKICLQTCSRVMFRYIKNAPLAPRWYRTAWYPRGWALLSSPRCEWGLAWTSWSPPTPRLAWWQRAKPPEEKTCTSETKWTEILSRSRARLLWCSAKCGAAPWERSQWTLRKRFGNTSLSVQCTIISFHTILC